MSTVLRVYKEYEPHLRKYSGYFLMCFAAGTIAQFCTVIAIPLLYKRIIDLVGIGKAGPTELKIITIAFSFIALAKFTSWAAWRVYEYAITYAESFAMRDIATTSFQKLSRHSYEFFTHKFTGTLVSSSNKIVRSFELLTDFVIFNVYIDGLRLIGSTAVLFFVSPLLGAFFLSWVLFYFFVFYLTYGRLMGLNENLSEVESHTTGVLADALTNILSIKMFARSTDEQSHYEGAAETQRKALSDTWNYQSFLRAIQRGLMAIFEVLALGTALYLWSIGSITAGTIILLQMYVFSAFDSVYNLTRNLTRAMGSLADADVMVKMLVVPESIKDPKHPEPLRIKNGAIDIHDMTFSYENSSEVFTNFSLHIPAGQKVGLVGHSGSGKTTITKLLLRFVDVQSGAITIDGQDIRSITQDDLRSQIAYVPQDPLLFHRSIAENIGYGNPVATQTEIIETAKRAHAHEFIERLPQGYNTLVGERGVRLSGGERQRVAIARAMIKNAPILILDEATSALDSISEKHIQAAFLELMKGRTTLVIAHRLSTIQKMDRIVVFERGAIVEDGTHEELIRKDGMYANLWRQQSSGFIE